ncbi:hypothetical protein DDB_G0289217 [Dictyostelium discoideum AX4]|uniref:Uncharacterized protein n=1 Tax=Dictyostelium discoideum TaxID=44689 RepID=Q54HU6_DICDI|nr:hypothetical protein DDB_G0289217 [Dictyostelium discoideum AX4]EAL62842.1 hypothetical protein DDB_G0289217 [Dictyostelium discoideum AX4]|eukprot:XP_636343.1 hypothetical protein DDB_G0289217 [Dictyostelium discoideum AX4]
MSNNSNKSKEVSIFLYRNLVRQCSKIDKNPQYKQYFVTPKSLRPGLPTFFLPSVSFLQKLKIKFRESCNENLKTNDIVRINSSISDGFAVLKNINLSKYANYESNQEQIMSQMKNFYNRIGGLNNEHEIDPTIPQKSRPLNSQINNNNINNNINNNNNTTINTKEIKNKEESKVEPKITSSTSPTSPTTPTTETATSSSSSSTTSEDSFKGSKLTKREQIKLQKQQLLEKQKEVKDRKFWPIKNNIEEIGEGEEEEEEGEQEKGQENGVVRYSSIKPGTILISHPSLGEHLNKKVVLITHSIGGHHYGFFINTPIQTGAALSYIDFEMKTHYDRAAVEANRSKNFSRLFIYALKRPIGPLKTLNWNLGGLQSITDHSVLSRGFDGLNCTQIVHPYSNLSGSKKIRDGLYIGGKLKEVGDKIRNKEIDKNKLLMFVGCSTWNPGQLEKEIKEGAWFRADCSNETILKQLKPKNFWAEALESMGGDYSDLVKTHF